MKKIPFTKMHGLGNNYIYIDCFVHSLVETQLPQLAIAVANVHTGIGSDGMILLCPSNKASIKMRIFNKDGSEGKNCGNGIRCCATYAYEHGYSKTKIMTIETLSGIVEATIMEQIGCTTFVKVNMGQPRLERSALPMRGNTDPCVIAEPFEIAGHRLHVTTLSMGNPHAIFFVRTIEEAMHRTLGAQIEQDSRFPEGVNVGFVAVESPDSLHYRVWERGSGATQACGTGACAAAVAAILNAHSKRETDIIVHLEGGNLLINWNATGDLFMTGPATTTAQGVFLDDSLLRA